MDFKQLVIVALQVSILSTVFGFGLKTTFEDMLYLVRRPGLLVRSLISVFLIVPVVAVVLDRSLRLQTDAGNRVSGPVALARPAALAY